jgi:hypothetical protein
MNTSHVLFAAAFSHVDPPPTFTSCWQMLPVFIRVYRAFVDFRVGNVAADCLYGPIEFLLAAARDEDIRALLGE